MSSSKTLLYKKRYCILTDKQLTEHAKNLCEKERLSFSQWVERLMVDHIKNTMPSKKFAQMFREQYPVTSKSR